MSFISDKILPYLPKLLPYLAVLVVGGGIGWTLKPSQVRVEEKLKVVEVIKEVVVTKESVRVEVVKVKDTQIVERWHREKTETKSPDGTIVKKEVEDRNINTEIHSHTQSETVKVVTVEKQIVVEKEKLIEKISTPVLAQWHTGVLVGINPSLLPTPTVSSYFIGAEVERRIVGPVFAGLWVAGSTTGQAFGGAKVSLEF
jgi:hypothetical protein